MTIKLANNATSRLSSPISSGDTTLSVMAGHGARFPTLGAGETFPITVVKADGTLEIMRVTERSSDVFTVTRGQEGTSPQTFSSGDRVELRLTDGALDERIDDKLIPRIIDVSSDYNGSTEPPVTWPYMTWADTGNMLLKRRNAANTAWITQHAIEPIASQEEVNAGTNDDKFVTPKKLRELVASEDRAGLIEIATTAEAQALTNDEHALTPKKLADAFGGANQGITPSGYQKLPGGLIIQWGVGQFAAVGGDIQIVTLPIAFPTACLACWATNSSSSGAGGHPTPPSVGANVLSASQIQVQQHLNVAFNTYFHWLAIGH